MKTTDEDRVMGLLTVGDDDNDLEDEEIYTPELFQVEACASPGPKIFVTMNVNGRRTTCIYDPGAQVSCVPKQICRALGLKEDDSRRNRRPDPFWYNIQVLRRPRRLPSLFAVEEMYLSSAVRSLRNLESTSCPLLERSEQQGHQIRHIFCLLTWQKARHWKKQRLETHLIRTRTMLNKLFRSELMRLWKLRKLRRR
eukprot:GHVP01028894.1.p1 GENE.GHVP01028894.1~~GHVP01028894.1.p1  ORF type:complete len:197 (-),score=17.36 GHVP01028894.1:349-939(-)